MKTSGEDKLNVPIYQYANKIIGWCMITFLSAILLSSCHSSKSILKEMHNSRAHLFYELTKPQYLGEIKNDVYLDFIDYSNMDYYTTVKKKSYYIIPLIFYNYVNEGFEAKLGEWSLSTNYREFLTDAFLAECNNSTCFNLVDNADERVSPDSVYTLRIKIVHNSTKAKIKFRDTAVLLIWPFGDENYATIESANHKLKPAIAHLKLNVILSKNKEKLFEKEYTVYKSYQMTDKGYGDVYMTSIACLDRMAESLSMATKEIVEEISEELHLLMRGN